MALVVADRVLETTTTTGTGTVTLSGAVTGYQSFSAVGNGNTTYYTIASSSATEWEVGIGTYTSSGTTLSRDTVLASSNSGSLVDFSAGVKQVFVTYPAGKSIVSTGATTLQAGAATFTNTGIPYASSTTALTTGSALTFDGTNFLTTGRATAASFVPSSSTVPTNGMYLSAANTLAFATNSLVRLTMGSSYNMTFGAGGTGTSVPFFNLNGGSASGGGCEIRFSKNSAAVGYFATESEIDSSTSDNIVIRATAGIRLGSGGSTSSVNRVYLDATGLMNVSGGCFGRGAPVTKTGDFSVATSENWLINNKSGSTCTVTLPTASSWTGREIMIQNYQAQTVVSASSNVVPLGGGAAGTAILASGAGKWCTLVSDGTNWIIMQGA